MVISCFGLYDLLSLFGLFATKVSGIFYSNFAIMCEKAGRFLSLTSINNRAIASMLELNRPVTANL
jgi:hypothetical protein